MPGTLEGIRVVDFGQYIAGPLAARLLSDQGADVIKISPPQRRVGSGCVNGGKRTILLDVEASDGQQAV